MGTDAPSATPDVQREVERKYDADPTWTLPDLQPLVPHGAVEAETVTLRSTYYDTADRDLLGARLTLRRRTGEPWVSDTGWQLKVPDGDARLELRWPLGDERGVPADVRDVTLGVRGRAALRVVATLEVERHRHRLLDADGACLAEVVDDTVTACRPGEPASSWREVEVELVDGGRAVLQAADRLLREAGAARSASASKLARALGVAPEPGHPPGSLAGVVGRYLDRQWQAIVRGDLDLRRGELPVHATRTAIRRYRSVLRVFAPVLDAERATALDGELQRFALALGEIRDAEVLRGVVADLLAELPGEVDAGAVRRVLDEVLDAEHAAAVTAVQAHLRGTRHLQLLGTLRRWHADLPLDRAHRAGEAWRFVRRADRKARKRLDAVPRHHDADDERMHRARKAAKRARYAAELADARGVGKRSRTEAVRRRNKAVQRRLGDRQDAVVAMALMRRAAVGAPADAAFGLGLLYERCRERAAE